MSENETEEKKVVESTNTQVENISGKLSDSLDNLVAGMVLEEDEAFYERVDHYFGQHSEDMTFKEVAICLNKYDFVNDGKLRNLANKGVIQTKKEGSRVKLPPEGLVDLADWVDNQLVKKAEKLFYRKGIYNNPVWDDKNNKVKGGDPFSQIYVTGQYDILAFQRNFEYDVTIKGDMTEIKSYLVKQYDTYVDEVNDENKRLNRTDPKYLPKLLRTWLFEWWCNDVVLSIKKLFTECNVYGKCFFILHDKDKLQKRAVLDENGDFKFIDDDEFKSLTLSGEKEIYALDVPKPEHIHGIVVLDRAVDYDKVYRILKISSEDNMKPPYNFNDIQGMFKYLIHDTDDARKEGKYLYSKSKLNYIEYYNHVVYEDDGKTVNSCYPEFKDKLEDGINYYELFSRSMNKRVEYIKSMVQLGDWSEKKAREVAKLYLEETNANKLIESRALIKHTAEFLVNEEEKYKANEKTMDRFNFLIVGGSETGKSALAENFAQAVGRNNTDFFKSVPKAEGGMDDSFGRYNGQTSGIFNEFKSMDLDSFKDIFDRRGIGNVNIKKLSSVPYIAKYNFFTTAKEFVDVIANILQFSKGGKHRFQNSMIIKNGERGFNGLADNFDVASEFTQVGRRLICLKIVDQTVQIYQFVNITDENGRNILREFPNPDGFSAVNFKHVGTVDGYNIMDYDGQILKQIDIAQTVVQGIKETLDETGAWHSANVSALENKTEYDNLIKNTDYPFESNVNETVRYFYDQVYSRITIAVIPDDLLYMLYRRNTYAEFITVKPLDRKDFETEFDKIIMENQSMVRLSKSKFAGDILKSSSCKYLKTQLSTWELQHRFDYIFDMGGTSVSFKSMDKAPDRPRGCVLDFKHIKVYGAEVGGYKPEQIDKMMDKVKKQRMKENILEQDLFDECVRDAWVIYDDSKSDLFKDI